MGHFAFTFLLVEVLKLELFSFAVSQLFYSLNAHFLHCGI